MRGCLSIEVTENEDGDFVASCGSIQVGGFTSAEAEELLLEVLETRDEGSITGHRESIYEDPDDVAFEPDPDA
jgi:hypothetical protein